MAFGVKEIFFFFTPGFVARFCVKGKIPNWGKKKGKKIK